MYRFVPLNLINSYAARFTEQTIRAKITTSENFEFYI